MTDYDEYQAPARFHDPDLEAQVLCEWISNPTFREAWTPEPKLFFTEDHQELADCCAALKDREPNAEDVSTELERRGKLGMFRGGAAGAEWILNESPALVDYWGAIKKLRELRDLARLRDSAIRLAAQLKHGELTLDNALGHMADCLRDGRSGGGAKTLSVQDCQRLALEESLATADNPTGNRWATGFDVLDETIGGLRAANVYLFGARTNWGKSYLVTAIADQLMRQGAKPLIVSLEDNEQVFGARLLARRANINSVRLRDGELQADEITRAKHVIDRSEVAPYYLNGRGRDVESIAADVRSLVTTEGIHCVIVDYLQKLTPKRRVESQERELSYCNNLLSDLVKNLGVIGIFTTQFTSVAKGERPTTEKVKGCRAIVESADFALFGWSPEEDSDELLVAKNKQGSVDLGIPLKRDPRTGNFLSGSF